MEYLAEALDAAFKLLVPLAVIGLIALGCGVIYGIVVLCRWAF